MSRDEFVAAFEQVVPGLYRKALAILGRQTPVDEWRQFLLELNSQHDKIYEAKEIVGILKALEIPLPSSFDQVNQLDAQQCSKVRSAIWQLFPDVNDLISRYEEFLANMDYATRRRNLRQLTLVASALTLCGNLTLARLLNGATFQSGLLFDTHIFVGLPAVLWHGQWSALLSYVAGCFLPALTIAGIADVLDRKIFAAASKDFRKLQFQPAIESRGKQKPTAGRAKGASAS